MRIVKSVTFWIVVLTAVLIAAVLNNPESRGSRDVVSVSLSTQSSEEELDFLRWCDKIYHRNVSCPKFGQVAVPKEVLDQERADTLAWCDKIYHRNVSCPKFGQVQVPQEVLDQERADTLAWCEKIYHQNVGCPGHGRVEVPREVLERQNR